MSFEKIGQAYVSGRAPVIHAGIQKQQKQSKKKMHTQSFQIIFLVILMT